MNIPEIDQKMNIFDHIFYEFEMYYDTFCLLLNVNMQRDMMNKQFWTNVLLESHAIHLRNLIHFFCGKDSINVNTVLINNPKLGIPDNAKKTRIIDKGVCHLTEERSSPETSDSLTIGMNDLINSMFPEICNRIKAFLLSLRDYSQVKPEYIEALKENYIQERYNNIINRLESTR